MLNQQQYNTLKKYIIKLKNGVLFNAISLEPSESQELLPIYHSIHPSGAKQYKPGCGGCLKEMINVLVNQYDQFQPEVIIIKEEEIKKSPGRPKKS